jgi:cold shock CspA family protein/ribosome-associated translation inhibitor RaiA
MGWLAACYAPIMQCPLQVTFRGIDHSDAIESIIQKRAERLDRFSEWITRCHITVDMPHQHRHRGNHFALHIVIETPLGQVAVIRDLSLDDGHKDFQSVVRDAFDTVTRLLENDLERQRGDVKAHQRHEPTGRVTRLLDGYGFLAPVEGDEVYFHENSVVDCSYADLGVGDEVRFSLAPEDSDQGARAASVQRVSPAVAAQDRPEPAEAR